jgi:hypothetical protein
MPVATTDTRVASSRVGSMASTAQPSAKPTFGQCADQYITAHEGAWRNRKHRQQWSQTLTTHAASIRGMPVDQVDANAVRRVLEPI